MGLRAIYNAKSDIPESVQSYYVERGGKWVLDVDAADGFSLGKTEELKTENNRLTTELAATKKQVEAFGEAKPEDLAKLREENERLKNAQPTDKDLEARVREKVEQQTEQIKKEANKKVAEAEELSGKSRKQLDSILHENAIHAALAKTRLAENGAAILQLALKDKVRVVDDGEGGRAVRVFDANGNPRASLDPDKKYMDVDELLGEFKTNDTYKAFFLADKPPSGTGSNQPAPGGTPGRQAPPPAGGTGEPFGIERMKFARGS